MFAARRYRGAQRTRSPRALAFRRCRREPGKAPSPGRLTTLSPSSALRVKKEGVARRLPPSCEQKFVMDCGRDLWRLPAQPLKPRVRLGDIRLQLGVRVHPNRCHEAVACKRFGAISQSVVDAGALQRPKRFPERRGRVPDLSVQTARCLALSAAGLEQLGADETLVVTERAE